MANPDIVLQYEVERFLIDEAVLLDERRLHEWLDLFTDDTRYWMPVVETIDGGRPATEETVPPPMPIFDDDKNFLILRVKRLDTGLAHSEQPPSRTRHLISNVRLGDIEQRGEETDLTAQSNFIVFQSRIDGSDCFFVGRREDRLRKRDGVWRIARRRIWLDQDLLPRAISILF